jgi:probable HAF family extracellular repeat protein
MKTPGAGRTRSLPGPLCSILGIWLLTAVLAGATVVSAASPYSLTYSLTDLGTREGSRSYALVINSSGQVAGFSVSPDGRQHALLYDGSGVRDLGTLGGDHSDATAINASGQVVGWAQNPSGQTHAFLYDGAAMRDLGTLGGNHSDALAINAPGQVVGRAETPSGEAHAFLYDGAAMRDLNSLLDGSGDGWTVMEARGINDAGQIAAIAYDRDAVYRAVLLTPRISVPIDIRADSPWDPINPKGHGRIPVAILSAPAFNAPAQVDQETLTFGRTGNEPSLAFCIPARKDVNGDGLADLVCQFHAHAAGFREGDAQGILKGRTVTGISLVGSDAVRILPAKRWPPFRPRFHRLDERTRRAVRP